MSRIALVLALLGTLVLGAGMPPCCVLAGAPEVPPPSDHGQRCPCCPEETPPAPAPAKVCVFAHTVSTLWHATDTVQLDAPAPSAFVAPTPLPQFEAPLVTAPSHEAGPPGPALTLPLLL